MRCPSCSYLYFKPVDACPKCGADLKPKELTLDLMDKAAAEGRDLEGEERARMTRDLREQVHAVIVGAISPEPAVSQSDQAMDRLTWLNERRKGLGGTDAAAIMGEDTYRSEISVWLDKTGQGIDQPDNPAMKIGRDIEPVADQIYQEFTGIQTVNPTAFLVHPKHPMLIGSADRLCKDLPRGVEIKTGSKYTLDQWGDPGTDEIPRKYIIQCAHYMAVTGFNEWDVAAIVGPSIDLLRELQEQAAEQPIDWPSVLPKLIPALKRDFRLYTLRRDLELEEMLIPHLVAWWERHVVQNVEPAVDGSDSAREWLKRKFPRQTLPLIQGDGQATEFAKLYTDAVLQIKAAEEIKDAMENRIKALIGHAQGIETPHGKFTWSNVKGRVSTDWEAIAKALNAPKELIEQHTKTGDGYRRFNPPRVK